MQDPTIPKGDMDLGLGLYRDIVPDNFVQYLDEGNSWPIYLNGTWFIMKSD